MISMIDTALVIPPTLYYAKRTASADYSEYWGTVTDPDGTVRDRLSDAERRQYVADCEYDLEFLRGLQVESHRILDVGCGPGWFLAELDGWEWWGTEVCDQAADAARLEGVRVVPMRRIRDSSFPVVRSHHVIEHAVCPEREIEQIRRVLERGGWLLMSTPDFSSPCAARFGGRYRMLHDKTHCSLFTCESMFRFLRDYGFDVEALRYPFAERYAGELSRWTDEEGVSPPFPGNWMTFYARKR